MPPVRDAREHHIRLSAEGEHEGVAPLGDGEPVRVGAQFVPVPPDLRKGSVGVADDLFRVVLHRVRLVADGSIDDFEFVRLFHRTARKAVLFADRGIRCEADALALPIDEIAAGRIRPADVPPVAAVGVVLVKEVVHPVRIHGAVRVVHPIFFGCEMYGRSLHGLSLISLNLHIFDALRRNALDIVALQAQEHDEHGHGHDGERRHHGAPMVGRRRAELLDRKLYVVPALAGQREHRPIVIAPLPDKFKDEHRDEHGHRRGDDDLYIGAEGACAVYLRRLDQRVRHAEEELAEHEHVKATEKARQDDGERRIEQPERAHDEIERERDPLERDDQHDDDEIVDDPVAAEVDLRKRVARHAVDDEHAHDGAERIQERVGKIAQHRDAREHRDDVVKGEVRGQKIAERRDLRRQRARGVECRDEHEQEREQEQQPERRVQDVQQDLGHTFPHHLSTLPKRARGTACTARRPLRRRRAAGSPPRIRA